jgi:nucleoid-associated protein YgaU
MGNFEKLGILVMIILVVVILVIAVSGMGVPSDQPLEQEGLAAEGARLPSENGRRAPEADDRGERQATTPVVDPKAGQDESDPNDWPIPDDSKDPSKGGGARQPVEPVDPPEPESRDILHVVKAGESLWKIAEQYYGNGKYMTAIQAANPNVNPNAMGIGTELTIPDPDEILDQGARRPERVTPQPRPVAVQGRTYEVRKGDTLSRIARTQLGNEGRWKELHRLNLDVIGSDPRDLRPGMKLRLPN